MQKSPQIDECFHLPASAVCWYSCFYDSVSVWLNVLAPFGRGSEEVTTAASKLPGMKKCANEASWRPTVPDMRRDF